MFWKIFFDLCKNSNVSPSQVVKNLSLSSSSVTSWKNGKVPHHGTLLKIAEYFGVTVDYLLGSAPASAEEKSPAPSESDLDARILEAWRQLDEKQVEDALRYIEFLKSKG